MDYFDFFYFCYPQSFHLAFPASFGKLHASRVTVIEKERKSFHESQADTHERYIPLRGKSIIPLLGADKRLGNTLSVDYSHSTHVFLSVLLVELLLRPPVDGGAAD